MIEHAKVGWPRQAHAHNATDEHSLNEVLWRLLSGGSGPEIDSVLRSQPPARRVQLVVALADIANRAVPVSPGPRNPALGPLAVAAHILGSHDTRLPSAVATVVRAARLLSARDILRTTSELAANPRPLDDAASAAELLLASGAGSAIDGALASELWVLVADLAPRASEISDPIRWRRLAVEATRRSIEAADPNDPQPLTLLNDLSIRLAELYRVDGDQAKLTEAVATARRVVALTSVDDPRLATRLANLSNRHCDLFEATNDPLHLELAVMTARRAVATAHDDLDSLPLLIENLNYLLEINGGDHSSRPPPLPLTFTADQRAYADRASKARRDLAALETADDGSRAQKLEALADSLALLFRVTGDVLALEEATLRAREAFTATPRDDPRWAPRAAKLASRLTEQYRSTGGLETNCLIEALDLSIEVTRFTPASSDSATRRLENLGDRAAEAARLDRGGKRLTSAIEAAAQLLAGTDTQHPDRLRRTALLASMLVELHRRTSNEMGEAALADARRLVDEIPPDRPELEDFINRCRRQLRAAESFLRSIHDTFDLTQAMREAAVDSWLDGLATTVDEARDNQAPPTDDEGLDRGARRRRSRSSPVTPPQIGDGTVRMVQIQIWLLFLLPAGLRIGALGGVGTPSLVWGLLLFPTWAITSSIPPYTAGRPCYPLRWMLGIFWASTTVSFALLHRNPVAADEASNADRYILSFIAFTGLALTIAEGIHTRAQQLRVIRALVTGVSVMSLIGLLQFKFAFDVTVYMERIPGLATSRELNGVFVRDGFNRPAGTASHPIEFSVIVAATLALAIHLLLYDRWRPISRRWMALGLLAIGIPITVSRSALLVSVPVVLVFLLDANRQLRIKASVVIAGVLMVVFVFVPGLLGTLKGFVFAGNSDSSIATRTGDYSAISPFVRANPWFGRGPGTFLPRYRILDNQYLLSLVETGVTGLLVTIGLYSLPAWLSSASRSKMTDPRDRQLARMLLAIGLGVIAAAATFDATSFPMFMLYAAIVLGLAGNHWNRAVYRDHEQGRDQA